MAVRGRAGRAQSGAATPACMARGKGRGCCELRSPGVRAAFAGAHPRRAWLDGVLWTLVACNPQWHRGPVGAKPQGESLIENYGHGSTMALEDHEGSHNPKVCGFAPVLYT